MTLVSLVGLESLKEKLGDLPTVLDSSQALADVARQFKDRMSAVTPAGYSGRLKRSVIAEFDAEEVRVGYESGVETAGNPKLDSVLKPRTRGRSVFWVPAADLGELLAQDFEDFEGEALSVLAASFGEMLDGRS